MKALSEHWEKIHSSKLKDVSWWQEKGSLWLDLFSDLHLEKSDPIIDVGSGATELISALLESGFSDVTALDISSSAIENLRSRLGASESRVNYIIADVRSFEADRKFALWHDRAVFHFLTEESDQIAYVESALSHLAKEGTLIVATFAPNGPEQCSNLPVARHDQESLVQIFGEVFSLIDCQTRIHVTPWGNSQPFTVARFTAKRAW